MSAEREAVKSSEMPNVGPRLISKPMTKERQSKLKPKLASSASA
jgi:hypothetical protein